MTRWRSWGGLLAVAAAAWLGTATTASAQPGTGISGTRHDFSVASNTQPVGACTFCHTPHKATQTRLLWNHTLSANTFSWDVTTTTGGTPYSTIATSWQGPSKYCLSCHDGSVAIGDVAWFRAAPRTGAAALNAEQHNGGPGDPYQIAQGASMAGNHPVAHPFPFNGAASTYNGVTTGVPALASGWRADPTAQGIRLFTQSGANVAAGTAAGTTGIECSSCHDPHNNPSAVQDDFFLRGSRDARDSNYICRKCHLVMGDYQDDRSLHPHRPR